MDNKVPICLALAAVLINGTVGYARKSLFKIPVDQK